MSGKSVPVYNTGSKTTAVNIRVPDVPPNTHTLISQLAESLDTLGGHFDGTAQQISGIKQKTGGAVQQVVSDSSGKATDALANTWTFTSIDGNNAYKPLTAAPTHLAQSASQIRQQLPIIQTGMAAVAKVNEQRGHTLSVAEVEDLTAKVNNLTMALDAVGMALSGLARLIDNASNDIPLTCATGFSPGGPHPIFQKTAFDSSVGNGTANMLGKPGWLARLGKAGAEGGASSRENETLIEKLASKLHERWQKERNYEPRIKDANDPEWTARHNGETQLDIANTPYEELPTTWQAENRASAKAALEIVQEMRAAGEDLTKLRFVKSYLRLGKPQILSSQGRLWKILLKAGDRLHENWLSRNGAWAPADQKLPFNQLSAEEQQKDLVVILEAVLLLP